MDSEPDRSRSRWRGRAAWAAGAVVRFNPFTLMELVPSEMILSARG